MSSNIQVQRICQYCGKEFLAKTTVTKYCGDPCAKKAYKDRKRAEKIQESNKETIKKKSLPIAILQTKEFLTVKEAADLLNCSKRSIYYYIELGTIKATNLGQRLTRIKRSEIDSLFTHNSPPPQSIKPAPINISDCYTLREVQIKYKLSPSALNHIIKRNGIPKTRKGKYAYVPKNLIDEILM